MKMRFQTKVRVLLATILLGLFLAGPPMDFTAGCPADGGGSCTGYIWEHEGAT